MRTIPLTKGYEAIVDDEDYERFGHLKWRAQDRWIAGRAYVFAARSQRLDGRRTTILLHRAIMGAGPGQEVDHCDGDPLNCRRSNMRLCSRQQNVANRPRTTPRGQYRGVVRNRSGITWRAQICVNYEKMHLGSYGSPEAAAAAYNAAAILAFGEFAVLNDISGGSHG